MTLKVKISTDTGTGYHAKVKTLDHGDREKTCAREEILEPGQSTEVHIHSGRSLEVVELTTEEVAAYNQKKADAAAKAESDAEIAKADTGEGAAE
jgi:hypothetical protein